MFDCAGLKGSGTLFGYAIKGYNQKLGHLELSAHFLSFAQFYNCFLSGKTIHENIVQGCGKMFHMLTLVWHFGMENVPDPLHDLVIELDLEVTKCMFFVISLDSFRISYPEIIPYADFVVSCVNTLSGQ